MDDKELKLEEAETEKEFYVAVNYYSGDKPYCGIYETRDTITKADTVYKIRIPYKPFSEGK